MILHRPFLSRDCCSIQQESSLNVRQNKTSSKPANLYSQRFSCVYLYLARHSDSAGLYYARRPPTTHPRPNVIAAASNPSNTCRPPDLSSDAPVVSVIPIPTMNKPRMPRNKLTSTAIHPLPKANGNTGMAAPTAKSMNEVIAAS